jgi:D-threonate/D-erythronate kinase
MQQPEGSASSTPTPAAPLEEVVGRPYPSAMVPDVLVLADDLTGALEAGAAFAAAGIEAAVTAGSDPDSATGDAGVRTIVVDTETRHVDPQRAHERVFAFAARARKSGIRYLLKKTDSTLRGNVASEITAASAAWEGVPVFYVPAYPRLGRTVRGGVLHVDGRPVSQTSFGRDRWNPVRESHISTLLRAAGVSLPVIEIVPAQLDESNTTAFYVVDGETEQDVRQCALSLSLRSRPFVMAGPAGLAHHFAELVKLPRTASPAHPQVRRCLVVSGSLHPNSAEQVSRAVSSGVPATDPNAVKAALDRKGWAILRNPEGESADALQFARDLGRTVAEVIASSDPDAVVIFGGDTAFGVISALGAPLLRCQGELDPGIPASVVKASESRGRLLDRKRDLMLITKAGGFGPPDVIARLRQRLTAV